MATQSRFKHWHLERDDDNIAWCSLDVRDAPANVLSEAVLAEFGQVLDELEGELPRGLVIRSAREAGFIAGADVHRFADIDDPAEARDIIRRVHGLFDRLENLPSPSICIIKGYCLGGGLELALACRMRIGMDDPATRLGFPEVLLGIFPGFGGTMRAVRRIGAMRAMRLMLTGRSVDARQARSLGLLDRVLPERRLEDAARALLLQRRAPHRGFSVQRLLTLAPLRMLTARLMRRQLRRRVRGDHYPAPYRLVEHWERNGGSRAAMLEGEARLVPDLLTGDTSRNLVRAYLLRERLRGLGSETAPSCQTVHVIGAGVMGGDIAAWCALRGLRVTLQDQSPRLIAPAVGRAHALFRRKLKSERRVRAAMDRLVPDLRGHGAQRADLVIEAIAEDRDAKCELLRSLEPRLKENALLATNTSSIPLEQLGEALEAPERLFGMHFFNPVSRMQLVEIVVGSATSSECMPRAAALCRMLDRLPLPVKSSPGFLVNRVLTPYLMESTRLLDEGVSAEQVDAAATAFGMPMGPVELADTVGLDVCLSVARNLASTLDIAVPARLEGLVEAGRLGRKTGRGFYSYHQGKAQKSRQSTGDAAGQCAVQERLVLTILNECAACLREGIVENEDLLDAGMIFATGFAPHRGGPMHYARARGTDRVVEALTALQERLGDRYRPDPWWKPQSS